MSEKLMTPRGESRLQLVHTSAAGPAAGPEEGTSGLWTRDAGWCSVGLSLLAEEVEELSEQYAAEGTPSIEVRVFRGRDLIERQLCESEAEAIEVVEKWAEFEDVTCLVDDLSFHHTPDDVLAPEPAAPPDETYPPS